MKSIIVKSALIFTVLIVPAFAFAQPYNQTVTNSFQFGGESNNLSGFYTSGAMPSCTNQGIGCVGAQIIYIINNIFVPVIFAVAFLMFIYGIAKAYIFSHGEPAEVKEGHQIILWGLIGFAVMISLWGLVNVVSDTFGLGGVTARPLPTSIPATIP